MAYLPNTTYIPPHTHTRAPLQDAAKVAAYRLVKKYNWFPLPEQAPVMQSDVQTDNIA
jgi:hypothetical protein